MCPVQNTGHPNKQVCDDVTAVDLVQHFVPPVRLARMERTGWATCRVRAGLA
jgi:hypothetical protein